MKIIPFRKKEDFINLEEINKKWLIDFDKEIENNAHTIPEKIAVFIWKITGKTGYTEIEFLVNSFFEFVLGFLFIAFIGMCFVFLVTGLEKLYLFLH